MAREQTDHRQSTRFGYNPVVGWLMESSPENVAALREVREQFDTEEWKRGFTGSGGLTGEARKLLEARGVKGEVLSGRIVAAYYAEQRDEARNQAYPFLRVKFVDENESYLVSLGLNTGPGQMLVQKLLAVEPGTQIRLAVFGTLRDGYANHAVSLKDAEGNEIRGPGGLFKEAETLAQQKIAVLQQQGLSSREVIAQARAQVKLDFHRQLLLEKVEPVFKAAQANQDSAPPTGDSHAQDAGDAPVGAADGFEDDGVPF